MRAATLFFLGFLSLGCTPLLGQDFFSLGPKLSGSVQQFQELRSDSPIRYATFKTVSIGVFARLAPGRLYVQPEVYYAIKGTNFSLPAEEGATGELRLRTFEAPVLLGYQLVRAGGFNLRAFAGPVFNLYTKEARNDLRAWDRQRYELKEKVHSLQAGIGMDVLMLTLDARYERGLTSYQKELARYPSQFTLSLGYKFF